MIDGGNASWRWCRPHLLEEEEEKEDEENEEEDNDTKVGGVSVLWKRTS